MKGKIKKMNERSSDIVLASSKIGISDHEKKKKGFKSQL